MSFFLSGVGATSVANSEGLQETIQQVQDTLSKIETLKAETEALKTQTEGLKTQTEQNNQLVAGFNDRLTDYDTSTIKFREV